MAIQNKPIALNNRQLFIYIIIYYIISSAKKQPLFPVKTAKKSRRSSGIFYCIVKPRVRRGVR